MIQTITEKQALDLAGTPRSRIKGLIGIHSGVFHADDVFAAACLDIASGSALKFVRTRDPQVLDCCQIVLDVGGVLDPTSGRFDHHQKSGGGFRPGGVPFATFGLLWNHNGWMGRIIHSLGVGGHDLIGVGKIVDESLVQAVDAADCGWALNSEIDKTPRFSISEAISAFNPSWMEAKTPGIFDTRFVRAVEFARGVLVREIIMAASSKEAVSTVRLAIRSLHSEPELLVLTTFCPWQETVVSEAPGVRFVVFPSETGDFRVQAVPDKIGSFGMRMKLPASWAGLRGFDLAVAVREQGGVIGNDEAVFCHIGRFIAGATSFEAAMQMALTALKVGREYPDNHPEGSPTEALQQA